MVAPDAGGRRDAGPPVPETQPERTELAWIRTALACAGLGAAFARLGGAVSRPWALLALSLTVSLPGLVAATWRMLDLRRSPVPTPPRTGAVAMLAGSVVLGVAVVLVGLLV